MQLEIITKQDLEDFRARLLEDIRSLLKQDAVKENPEWLRSAEVRKMLKISAGTLQNLRVSGKLKPSKINGSFYYRSKEVKDLLESGT